MTDPTPLLTEEKIDAAIKLVSALRAMVEAGYKEEEIVHLTDAVVHGISERSL